MASNKPAPETPFGSSPASAGAAPFRNAVPFGGETSSARETPFFADEQPFADATPFGEEAERAWGEWNGSEPSAASTLRGRHRVAKQRNSLARSSTVLGVGVIAAVGAGGIATAQGKPPVPISVPHAITEHVPAASSLPVVGSLLAQARPAPAAVLASEPLTTAGMTTADLRHGSTDAGEALRARILQQAQDQENQADQAQQAAAEKAAAEHAAAEAGKRQAAAEKQAAEAKKKAAAAAEKKAEAERLARLAKSYTLPVVSYTITGTFGQPGSLWASGFHTGLDFAAPTGTPIKAVHGGTVTAAGWDGSYGYRTVVKLDDGEELWYCHQSSMTVSVGRQVATGEVIGRVGATGNVTGPHLHLEVRTTDGTAIDPRPWLEDHGLKP